MSTFKPTYFEDSLHVLVGTVGFGSIAAGSDVLTCGFNTLPGHAAPEVFTPADVGCIITVFNAGPSHTILRATIASFTSFNQVRLDTAASFAATNDWTNTTVYRGKLALEGSLRYEGSITSFDTAEVTLKSMDGSFWPVEGQPILLQSDDPTFRGYFYRVFFGGLIANVKITRQPGTLALYSECKCQSWESIAARRALSVPTGKRVYVNQTAAAIFTDVVNGMTSEGVGVNAVTGPTLVSFAVDNLSIIKDVLDALTKACNSDIAVFAWKTDPWRIFRFYQQGSAAAPWNIDDRDGSDGNVLIGIPFTRTVEKCTNSVTADASKTLNTPVTEIAKGQFPSSAGAAFSRRGFIFTQAPAVTPKGTINTAPIVIGETTVDPTEPSTWTIDNGYGVSWLVNITGSAPNFTGTLVSGNNFTSGLTGKFVFDSDQGAEYLATFTDATHLHLFSNDPHAAAQSNQLIRPRPQVPAGANWAWVSGKAYVWTDVYTLGLYTGDTLALTYQTAQKLTAFAQYGAGVTERANVEGGSGIYESVLKLDQTVTPESVLGYAQATADSFGETAKTLEPGTLRPGLAPGQSITLHLTEYGINGSYIITDVSMQIEDGTIKWTAKACLGAVIGDWIIGLLGGMGEGLLGTGAVAPGTVPPETDVPVLLGISPSNGNPGATVSVTLTGTNFLSTAVVTTDSPDITVSSVVVVNATTITANFGIGIGATFGTVNITVSQDLAFSSAVTFFVNVPSIALAPNITVATVAAGLALSGGAVVLAFSGSFTLPGTLGTLAEVRVNVINGPGKSFTLFTVDTGLVAGAAIAYARNMPQLALAPNTAAVGGYAVEFVCVNVEGKPTPGPLTIGGLTGPAYQVSTPTATDDAGDRWQDPGGALHAVLAVGAAAAAYPIWATLATNSPQYGRLWHGWFALTAGGTIYLGKRGGNTTIFPPTVGAENVTVYIAPGTLDAALDITTAPGVQSCVVSVSAPGTFGAGVATVVGTPGITYYTGPGGAGFWYTTIVFTLPLTDPKFFFARLYVQTGYYATPGNPATFTPEGPQAVRTSVGDWAGPNGNGYNVQDHDPDFKLTSTIGAGSITATVGHWPVPNTRDLVYRWSIDIATRQDDGSGGTKTTQNAWAGGAAFLDLVLDGSKSLVKSVQTTAGGHTLTIDPANVLAPVQVSDGTNVATLLGNELLISGPGGTAAITNTGTSSFSKPVLFGDNVLLVSAVQEVGGVTTAGSFGVSPIIRAISATGQTGTVHIDLNLGVGVYEVSVSVFMDIVGSSPHGDIHADIWGFKSFSGGPYAHAALQLATVWADAAAILGIYFISAMIVTDGVADIGLFSTAHGGAVTFNVGSAFSNANYGYWITVRRLQ